MRPSSPRAPSIVNDDLKSVHLDLRFRVWLYRSRLALVRNKFRGLENYSGQVKYQTY